MAKPNFIIKICSNENIHIINFQVLDYLFLTFRALRIPPVVYLKIIDQDENHNSIL